MSYDPILDEIHKIRDAHAKKFNYDLDAIYADWKQREKASGREYVSFPPKLLKDEKPLFPLAKPTVKSARKGKRVDGAAVKRKRSA